MAVAPCKCVRQSEGSVLSVDCRILPAACNELCHFQRPEGKDCIRHHHSLLEMACLFHRLPHALSLPETELIKPGLGNTEGADTDQIQLKGV